MDLLLGKLDTLVVDCVYRRGRRVRRNGSDSRQKKGDKATVSNPARQPKPNAPTTAATPSPSNPQPTHTHLLDLRLELWHHGIQRRPLKVVEAAQPQDLRHALGAQLHLGGEEGAAGNDLGVWWGGGGGWVVVGCGVGGGWVVVGCGVGGGWVVVGCGLQLPLQFLLLVGRLSVCPISCNRRTETPACEIQSPP